MERKIGDSVMLPKGFKIGMGELKKDTWGKIDHITLNTQKNPVYGVLLDSGRHTWATEAEIAGPK